METKITALVKKVDLVGTPFGPIPKELLDKFCQTLDVYWNTDTKRWVFRSQKLTVTKEKRDFKGHLTVSDEKLYLPFKAYNFEYWLIKNNGNVQKALDLTKLEYLPEKLDYSSYSKMFDELKGGRELHIQIEDVEWEDAIIKTSKQMAL